MGKYNQLVARRNRLIPRLGMGAMTLWQNRQRLARGIKFGFNRSITGTMTKKRQTSGLGVTQQHDRRMVYRKRRMPRRFKRRWRNFSKKVLAVSEKDLGSRTVVRNDLINISVNMAAAAATQHTRSVVGLYGCSSGSSYMNDINEISQDTDLGTTGKAIFKSAILDLTFRNISSRGATSVNPSITLEVDLYEITLSVELGQVGRASNLIGVFNEAAGDTNTIPGQLTGLASTDRGWSPWDYPSALSEYRIKIWKKTKYFLGENQTFTYQFRDPRRHMVDKQRMSSPGENLPGLTRYILLIFKPTPGYTYDGIDNYGLSIGDTRKYMYKIVQSTQDYDMYNT